MKSNSSANTKNAPKKNLTRVKAAQKSAVNKSQKPKNECGPFQGLDSQNAGLLPALICAIEQDLTLKGLDPSICRRTLQDGLTYSFSVSGAVSIEIGVTKLKAGTHLRFWINAVFGHALPGAKRLHLLETLLQMNSMVTFPIFLGVTPDNHIQAQYTARVHDQLTLASIGDTLDRIVGYTMSIREKLNEQIGFAPLSFRGGQEEPEPTSAGVSKEGPANEPEDSEQQASDVPGPNGWVH